MGQSYETNRNETLKTATELAEYLYEHKAKNVLALDVGAQTSIAEAFVLATASSDGQLRGLYRRLHDVLDGLGLPARQSVKRSDESGWLLLDTGAIIVHLMLPDQRAFYELEKLWFDAGELYRSEE